MMQAWGDTALSLPRTPTTCRRVSERPEAQLHEIGEAEVKHGIKIGVVNFFDGDVGNATLPEKIHRLRQVQAAAVRRRAVAWSLGAIAVVATVGAAFWIQSRRGEFATAPGDELQKSIAVLPLENLSEDKADAFFADGIQDDVLTSLSKISDLKVISRTSVMQYRSAKRNLRDIGHALGVGNILEGSVRRVGNRVMVNVQLIDAIHDRHLWSERYDRTLTNSIGLQGELATEIAQSLRARLNPEEKVRLASKPTNNPEAYILYLQAREKERTAVSYADRIAVDGIYERAVSLDPQFASAMARQSLWNTSLYMEDRTQERKNKAQALAVQALRVAPDLPEAHMALGEWFRLTERNSNASQKEISTAAQAMPHAPEILGRLGVLYWRQGRWREALENFHRVQELDPRVPHDEEAETAVALRDWKAVRVLYRHLLEMAPEHIGLKTDFAVALMNGEGDFAAARAILETIPYPRYDAGGQPIPEDLVPRWRLLMLERDFAGAERLLVDFPLEEFPAATVHIKGFFIARTAWAKGDQPKARELFEKGRRDLESIVRGHPDDPALITWLGVLYAYLGRKEEALRYARRAVDLVPENDAIERPAYSANLALVYALTGESEKAVTLIEQLLTKPSKGVQGVEPMTLTNLRSWSWDALRSNPRFQEILASPEPKTVY